MPTDYKSFQSGESKKSEPSGQVGYWWQAEDSTLRAQALIGAARFLKEDQTDRTAANLRHARLYGNFDALGFGLREYARANSVNQIALNVVASCVDTLTAKVAKNKPRPSFQTSGGSFIQQQKAKKLDKFGRGIFYEGKYYERVAPRVFRDACIFGTGAVKIFLNEENRVRFERVLVEELFVDQADAIHGEPRQLLQRKLIAREVLLAEFGKDETMRTAIERAKMPDNDGMKGFGDVVEVWEAWHLPSSKKAKDGRHVIAIDGACLVDDEWKHDWFPFAFLHYKPRVLGFWGQGLAECLTGIQLEINRLLRSVSEQLRRKGRGRIFLQKGSGVTPGHMTNGIADIITYNGHPPIVDSQNSVAPEEFMQLDRLYQRAFQEAGISELSAGAKKPSGLDAAVALREFNDIETERFSMVAKDYEQLALDTMQIAIDLVCEAGGGGYKVKLPNKRAVEEIDWKDINLERDSYTMQMFPVSSLPQTPAARRQAVRELMNDGFVPDKAEARRLLDYPDLESEGDLATAVLDDVDATISKILDADKPELMVPEDYQNLPMLLQRAQAMYLRVRFTDIETERLDMLRQLIDQTANKMLEAQKAAMPAPPEAPPGPPMPPEGALPGAPNVSLNQDFNLMGGGQGPVPPVAPPIVGA